MLLLLPTGLSALTAALRTAKLRSSLLRHIAEPIVRGLRRRTTRIRSGAGKGLHFNPHGAPLATALGINEGEVQALLVEHLHPGDTFYDVGANVGFFTLIGARLVGPTGRVIAFEPIPAMAAAVRHNALLNEMAQVEVFERAVSDSPARVHLQLHPEPTKARLLSAGALNGQSETVEVEAVALDPLVESGTLPPPTVVKMDIEGAEVVALAGLRRTIARYRPVVIYEVHGTQASCAAFFRSLGYALYPVESEGKAEHAPDYTHVIALPPGAGGNPTTA